MIRQATEADAVAKAEIYAPAVSASAISFELVEPTPEEMALLVLRERVGEPSPPRPPSAVEPEWEAALREAEAGPAR